MFKKILVLLMLLFLAVPAALGANEITNLTATDIQQRSITVSWDANTTQYNTSIYIDGVLYVNISSPVSGTQSTEITGLTKGTSYVVGAITYAADSTNASALVTLTVVTDGDLSSLWEFITEFTDNQDIIIGIIIFIVVLGIVRVFGKSLGNMLDIGRRK